jgi:uncharacterized protein
MLEEFIKMANKVTVPGELSFATGLLLISIAISLMVRADFGISTISSLPYALSSIFVDVSFGTWNIIFQICLLMILVAITRKFRSGYMVSFLIAIAFGYIVEFFNLLMSQVPTGIGFRLLYFAASYPVMCFAIALMVGSKIPLMIVDSFINDLSVFYRVTFRRMKTLCDITFMALSIMVTLVLLGDLVGVGIGTVIMALTTGSGVHAANKVLNRAVIIRPWSKGLSAMAR